MRKDRFSSAKNTSVPTTKKSGWINRKLGIIILSVVCLVAVAVILVLVFQPNEQDDYSDILNTFRSSNYTITALEKYTDKETGKVFYSVEFEVHDEYLDLSEKGFIYDGNSIMNERAYDFPYNQTLMTQYNNAKSDGKKKVYSSEEIDKINELIHNQGN